MYIVYIYIYTHIYTIYIYNIYTVLTFSETIYFNRNLTIISVDYHNNLVTPSSTLQIMKIIQRIVKK